MKSIIKFIILLYLIYQIILKWNVYPQKNLNIDTIYEIENFLSETECKSIINMTTGQFKRSEVVSKEKITSKRTSYQTWLTDFDNPIIKKISQLAIVFTKLPRKNQENLQVVRYEKSQEYKPHYDACIPYIDTNCQEDLEKMGSFRFATVLVYLNDDYSGGGTFFPKRNYTVTPKQGKVIMFYNLSPTNRNVLESSLHGGLPVTEGKKYICNFWIRLKPIKS